MTRKGGVLVSLGPPEGSCTVQELAVRAGVTPAFVELLVRIGVIDLAPAGHPYLSMAEVPRVRLIARLRFDLGVNVEGAAIIADLVERIEELEDYVTALRR